MATSNYAKALKIRLVHLNGCSITLRLTANTWVLRSAVRQSQHLQLPVHIYIFDDEASFV
eukprot:scaffold1594_cov171-Ochromonas_danica.AAC.23